MTNVSVVVGAGSIGQAFARRVMPGVMRGKPNVEPRHFAAANERRVKMQGGDPG